MRKLVLILMTLSVLAACKNNENSTASTPKRKTTIKLKEVVKPITIDPDRQASQKTDIRVITWDTKDDALRVIINYTGGCETHDFNAYFSGAWQKSLPLQAVVEIEHVEPVRDACRSLITDTLYFDLKPLRHEGHDAVIVKWNMDSGKAVKYTY